MPWEQRKGGRYYIHKRRVNGRVERLYIGGGLAGEIAEELDRIREDRDEQQLKWQQRMQQIHRETADRIEQYQKASTLLISASLITKGFRRHDRGNWRKTRVPEQ